MIPSRIPDQSSVWRDSVGAAVYHGKRIPVSCWVEMGKESPCSRNNLSKHKVGSGLAFGAMKEVYVNTEEMLEKWQDIQLNSGQSTNGQLA